MTAPRAPRLRSTVAAATLLLVAGGAARAEQVRVHYGVSLIGLTIGSAVVTGTVEPTSYKIDASAKVGGLASILSTSHGAASATGAIVGARVAPATYANTAASATMTRTIRVAMNAGTVTGLDISPPFDPDIPRVPIAEADKRDIVDPLSAFLIAVPPEQELVGPAACARKLPLFDGGVRFDIVLSFVGTRHVKTKGFEGEAAVCSARYVPISGQRVNSKASAFWAENKNLEVWVAPLAGTRLVFPFRISIRTMIGTAVVEADDFSVDGTTHASVR